MAENLRFCLLKSDVEKPRRKLFQRLGREIRDEQVLRAMAEVPREEFVLEQSRRLAYDDVALSIGGGQTISQPFMVALMSSVLSLAGDEKVLEVGTGSGYQAAVLSNLLPRGSRGYGGTSPGLSPPGGRAPARPGLCQRKSARSRSRARMLAGRALTMRFSLLQPHLVCLLPSCANSAVGGGWSSPSAAWMIRNW